ncbi:MAG: MFS transporter, partial [Nocardia sp.]|nr:MFS transporter [Nocardia sp.]
MSTIEVITEPGSGWTWAQRRTLIVTCPAVALVIASMAALYSALPQVAVATGADRTESAWIVDGYTLALACLVLPAGALGDRYGRRLLLLIGLAVFAVASVLPLFTAQVEVLIAARALAGVGAALVMPSTLSLITAGFPAGTASRAIGVWAGFAGSGGLLGLAGAGLLLRWWSWQSVFAGLAIAAALLFAAGFVL